MRRINQRDNRIVREIRPRRDRTTVTADEVIAHLNAKPLRGARSQGVAVRSITIAIEEICSGSIAGRKRRS